MLQAPKILIVDDEPRMRESMGTLLGTLGLEIESAQSGQEALARLSLFDFELALLDIGLPDMSGYDLMDRMKAQSPDLPVIVITGDSQSGVCSRCPEEGGLRLLEKTLRARRVAEDRPECIEPEETRC